MVTATTSITEKELRENIISFLKKKDTGALATSGVDTRVSPVKYFLGEELDIYIYSDGGSKFDNLKENNQVCLLVSTEFYGDYKTIKGVQVFGKAQIGDSNSYIYQEAIEYCPFDSLDDQGYIIKINAEQVVYKDSVDGNGEKHIWNK